jgi:CelD/BcsL family acetyltransferase involved in cellulose biosynthesis
LIQFGSTLGFPGASVNVLDPIIDKRWEALAASHHSGSVFHQPGWLNALASTYGYRPLAITMGTPGQALSSGLVFCEVRSWITGSRLVSLPFSDHCAPLVNSDFDFKEFRHWISSVNNNRHWRYIELRPTGWEQSLNTSGRMIQSFWSHILDLSDSPERIYARFHKDCVQRRIRHAEHEKIAYERGRSERLLQEFYRLLLITRRRHHLLPQPYGWFRNLAANLGPNLEIRLARKDNAAIAATLSIRHNRTVVYKYGCSDERFHSLGAMPYLLWKTIEESRDAGANRLDFGRTDMENRGLTAFKDHFGTVRDRLTYIRFPIAGRTKRLDLSSLPGTRTLASVLPGRVSSCMGAFLYRHIG